MVNGISVNGLGEVAMDTSQTASNLIGLGKQLSHELLLGRNLHRSMSLFTDGVNVYSEMVCANYHFNLLLPHYGTLLLNVCGMHFTLGICNCNYMIPWYISFFEYLKCFSASSLCIFDRYGTEILEFSCCYIGCLFLDDFNQFIKRMPQLLSFSWYNDCRLYGYGNTNILSSF